MCTHSDSRRHRAPQTVPTPDEVRGGLCEIVWLLTCVVAVKYVLVIMTTGGFHGEGGTFALLMNIKESGALRFRPYLWRFYQMLAIVAAALIVRARGAASRPRPLGGVRATTRRASAAPRRRRCPTAC